MEHLVTNYSQITEHIWVGTNMCCKVHSTQLMELGFQADIDLEIERMEEPPHAPVYVWLPTVDHTAPSNDQLRFGVDAIASLVKAGKKIYVHCHNGHGRGPTLVAAYLMSTGMTFDEAAGLIQSKRPEVHLNEVQIAALQEFMK